jgi:hypothetical protein
MYYEIKHQQNAHVFCSSFLACVKRNKKKVCILLVFYFRVTANLQHHDLLVTRKFRLSIAGLSGKYDTLHIKEMHPVDIQMYISLYGEVHLHRILKMIRHVLNYFLFKIRVHPFYSLLKKFKQNFSGMIFSLNDFSFLC